jgi:hypothetical protein
MLVTVGVNIMDINKIKQTILRDARTGEIANRTGKTTPVSMGLSGPAGKRVVLATAKRVISTHSDVIKALANR